MKNNSQHYQLELKKYYILKSIEFEKNEYGTETKKYKKCHLSRTGFITNTFKEMWKYLNKHSKIYNIITINFNQDTLENSCCI